MFFRWVASDGATSVLEYRLGADISNVYNIKYQFALQDFVLAPLLINLAMIFVYMIKTKTISNVYSSIMSYYVSQTDGIFSSFRKFFIGKLEFIFIVY